MKEIYIDNTQIHSNTDMGILKRLVKPEINGLEAPEMRLPSFVRPNIDGSVVPAQLYGGRLISWTGKVWGASLVEHRTQRRLIADLTSILRDGSGNKMERTLKFKTMDDLLLQVTGYFKDFKMPDRDLLSSNYSASFYSPDPYIYSQDLVTQNIFLFSGGGMTIPMAIPMSMGVGGASQTVLANNGNSDAYPVLIFNGPLTNPTFANLTTGKTLNLTYTLNSGEYIVINTNPKLRTALFYSSPTANPINVRQYISGDFFPIAKGNNEVKLTNTTYNSTAYLNISYRHTYSGN